MPVYLRMTPEVSTIRAYDGVDGYDSRAPYHSIVTVSHLTNQVAYLHGAVGKLDRALWDQILDMLRERGITTVMLERRGRMKTITL